MQLNISRSSTGFRAVGFTSKMARAATGVILLGLLVVALYSSSEAAVTVINSALIPVDVETNGNHVTVNTGASPVHVDVNGAKEQRVQVSMGKDKKPIFVDVKDGDTIVIIPDFLGGGTINVNVNGAVKGHF
uniref:Uncharacterized protein n=2 Tax=Physcomitrium patens TaxID=3218 RepID=A0A2K1L1T5_PHYPA|nr:hypothetical protein PHYPA_002786 [Physcomitrium patens]